MKIKTTRSLIKGSENIDEGQIVDLPEGQARRWVELGYGVPYEIKPHVDTPVFPTRASGEDRRRSSSPPARQSKKKRSKRAEEDTGF